MSSRKILIVENDSSTRKLLDVLLRRHGHAPTLAGSGAEALELLSRSPFDLVIVDLMMPDVSGLEVIEYVARNAPRTPVVVCTAAGPKITDPLLSNVVKVVIRKPFNIIELTHAVDEHATPAKREPAVTVLIVDDDERARYIMRTLVAPARTMEAPDAEVALRAVAESRPDIILLDLTLPGMTGEELLRRLKDDEKTRGIPVVIVTSRQLVSPETMPALERADGYIYKGDLTRETVSTVLQVIVKTPSN